MIAVLEEQKNHEYQSELEEMFVKSNGSVIKEDVRLPKEYYSKGYIRKDNKKKKWYINIAFADSKYKKPYAIFVHTNSYESSDVADKVIDDMETLCRNKGIKEELIEIQRSKYSGQANVNKITRAIGLALRHNIPIAEIVGVLEENPDGFSSFLFHIKKLLSKFIKDGTKIDNELCPNCSSKNVIYQEGCKMCLGCGWSACG
jgi:ribonucleoside-diphosphate reductase alpha chain